MLALPLFTDPIQKLLFNNLLCTAMVPRSQKVYPFRVDLTQRQGQVLPPGEASLRAGPAPLIDIESKSTKVPTADCFFYTLQSNR